MRVIYPHDFSNEFEATSSGMGVKKQKSPAVGFLYLQHFVQTCYATTTTRFNNIIFYVSWSQTPQIYSALFYFCFGHFIVAVTIKRHKIVVEIK